MTDLTGLATKIRLEEAADDLHELVRAATKRVVGVTAAFALAGMALLFAIELVQNSAYLISYGRLERPARQLGFHYIITSGTIDSANLFVVGTAMLAVVAAINIGVAVMPKPTALPAPDNSSLQARAHTIVWNRSLGYASYVASVLSMFAAIVEWISGQLPDVWMSATLLTVIALTSTLIAANVAALTDDEAERLVGWRSRSKRSKQIRFGIAGQTRAWKADWRARAKLRWKPGILLMAFVALFFTANLLVIIAIALNYVRPLDELFLTWRGWNAILVSAVLFTVVGTYFIAAMTFLHRAAFSSRVRNGDFNVKSAGDVIHDRLRRFRRWFYVAAIIMLDCGLILLAILGGVESNQLLTGFMMAGVWVVLPQLLLSWAWLRGSGPFSYFLARAIRARQKECSRLDAQVAEWEAKLVASAGA